MAAQATRRTLKLLRDSFTWVQVVEYWQHKAMKRKDLFGVIDIVAIGEDKIIGVQCTTLDNHNARREKILRNRAMKDWLKVASLWIISWGKRNGRWRPKIEMLSIKDFQ